MGATRREVLRRLAGAGAAGLLPAASWAAAGGPRFLAAAGLPDGRFELLGLDADGAATFRLPLPGRGHAAAAHPERAEAVAFARRPGTFALVIDCAAGRETARLAAPEGWHFGGHGAFSRDGARLFTTESGPEGAGGAVGVWDAADGYRRIRAFPSGGIGPHEIRLTPDGTRLAVANGGLLTDLASGRAKLNLAEMAPNLAYLDVESGAVAAVLEPPVGLNRLSVRHLAAAADGVMAIALQWEGEALAAPPLLALHRPGAAALELLEAPESIQRRARNYAGSVAITPDARAAAITAPRGGMMLVFDLGAGGAVAAVAAPDLCGVAACDGGFAATTGEGRFLRVDAAGAVLREGPSRSGLAFDNHLVPV